MVILKALENLLRPLPVLVVPGRVDEQVIHVDDEPSFGDEVVKEVVHERLERSGGVTESEEHDSWFEETKRSDKHRLPSILRSDQHIVVSPAYVHLCKDA
jgi:hypothetical protein